MRVFTLYIGTRQPGAKESIKRILGESFPSYTFIEGEGSFRETAEPMWFVKIATTNSALVIATAEKIRSALGQEDVGIEYSSRYYRCTKDDHASDLKDVLASEKS